MAVTRTDPAPGAANAVPAPVSFAPQPATAQAQALPPLAVIVLNRLAYGPRPGDLAAFDALGADDTARLTAWVDQQLNPSAIDDSACQQVLNATRVKIRYSAASNGSYPAVNEARPLGTLTKTTAELWPLTTGSMNYSERQRPFFETWVATWVRAVHSKRQLFEVLVDFWHNHFNVSASNEYPIMCTMPVYDRDVIRKNALGNFRTFLEDVAKSAAMMYYLDNYNNKVSGAEGGNENYSRELFELHTFGTDNYYKFYDDRSQMPTITYGGKTYPAGYIDQDVYETASCLGGWSIDSSNGSYQFKNAYHYDGVKLVLNTLINNRDTSQEKDGRDVFDMLAGHPRVARFVIGKLCRRLISDDISQLGTLIDQAVDVWMANLNAADQIRQVVRVIITSSEFRASWANKVKRPFEAMAAFLRATEATLPIDQASVNGKDTDGGYWSSLYYQFVGTGHKLFEWPTPTGHPDLASYWISSNSTLRRWNLPFLVTQPWGGNIAIPNLTNWNAATETRSVTQIVDDWIARLFGYTISDTVRNEVISFLAFGGDPALPPKPTAKAPDWNNATNVTQRYQAMVQLLAACPEFHNR